MGSGPPPEAEQAWPQSSGEEELQLQLALAMSKEEADQVRGAAEGEGPTSVLPSCPHASPASLSTCSPCPCPCSVSFLVLPVPPSLAPCSHEAVLCFGSQVHSCFLCPLSTIWENHCPFLILLSPGLLSLYWPASLPGPLALASPALPLILSLRQPPSCGPEDDVQLQLALSLSREEHDKVRVASLPLPGLSLHLAQLRGSLPRVPEVPPLNTVCSLPALSQQL